MGFESDRVGYRSSNDRYLGFQEVLDEFVESDRIYLIINNDYNIHDFLLFHCSYIIIDND
jgi:hypothetical protein